MSVRHPLSVEVLEEECKIFLFASHRCAEALKDSSAGISSLAHSCQSRLLFPPLLTLGFGFGSGAAGTTSSTLPRPSSKACKAASLWRAPVAVS